MTRRLVLVMTAVAALVAIALAVPMVLLVANDQRAAFVADLEVETLSAASVLSSEPVARWAGTVESVASSTGARVVVVDDSLLLIADSDNSGLDRSFDRPEIQSALDGSLTSDIRYSATLATDLRYVAAPVVKGQRVVAAVRLSLPEDQVVAAVRRTQGWLAVFVVAVVVAAAGIAWLLARSIAAPLEDVADVARVLPEDLALRAQDDRGPREVREVASALNSTASRLGDMIDRAERVAADASHHLRTPLTGVRLRLEAIEETSEDPAIVAEAAAATAEVDRLTRRIDQVLALAKSDAAALAPEDIDVTAVVADRVAASELLATDRGLAIGADIEADVRVRAVMGSVARAADEIIGNALSYARSRIDVSVHREQAFGVLRVEDDGPGIPSAERSRVLQRFVRGSSAAPGGSGLGLALVAESAAATGGAVAVGESALGGCSIEVRWPLAAS
ncbi:MAG: HAMP domain-containing histidine kinase [Actinomycetales bacterium]|nr:HAMP domain-containing histidine kinase [Actinomycetales bacterium]